MEATLARPWERQRSVGGTKGRRFSFPLWPRAALKTRKSNVRAFIDLAGRGIKAVDMKRAGRLALTVRCGSPEVRSENRIIFSPLSNTLVN